MNAVIALVGDYREAVTAHRAIPRALELARTDAATKVTWS
jgi:CTP synthase (UTP-ammonia lyase)